MKTTKFLKFVWICQIIFLASCIISTLCFALSYYSNLHAFYVFAKYSSFLWLSNPIAFYTLIGGMVFFFIERKHETHREIIGRKWIWFIALFLIDFVLWLSTGMALVFFTGGV